MQPIIQLAGVSRVYRPGDNEVRALDGVSFSVQPGELAAVVGPSGSGKSTLMQILGCLDQPDAGSYRFAGTEVGRLGERALSRIRGSQIGFVFQSFQLLPGLSAQENVELPLFYRGWKAPARRAAAEAALRRVGLGARMDHLPGQLSGGQQQRAAIARAVAGAPAVILADEPTGNLDTAAGAEVTALLRELWQGGATVLLITHDRALAAGCQRILEIKDGRLFKDTKKGYDRSAGGIGYSSGGLLPPPAAKL